jgi:hypothetical protein
MHLKHLILALAFIVTPIYFSTAVMAEEKPGEHKHAAGAGHKLGEITLGGTTFTVELEGHVHAGEECEVKLTPKGAIPAGVLRGWIGDESGKGSVKGKAHKEDGALCVHAEAPKPIPADAKIWLELDVDGNKSKASLALPKH